MPSRHGLEGKDQAPEGTKAKSHAAKGPFEDQTLVQQELHRQHQPETLRQARPDGREQQAQGAWTKDQARRTWSRRP